MRPVAFDLLASLVEDPANGWSIGTFGAIGEFMRDSDEPTDIRRTAEFIEAVTDRGAMRVEASPLHAIAWDLLLSDGRGWAHEMAICAPRTPSAFRSVRSLGPDAAAIRERDRGSRLFDLGIGTGCVRMCVRTDDRSLIALLVCAEGEALFDVPGVMPTIMRAQPHRVMLSPAGRIEVFQPIPPPDGLSPLGPHTHVLPHIILKDRAHSSNVPIPDGWQAALSMHPKSPWCTPLGKRHAYEPATDARFAPLLARFGLEEDETVAVAVTTALDKRPEAFEWPRTRRERHKARITLRRLAAAGDPRTSPWRALYDHPATRVER